MFGEIIQYQGQGKKKSYMDATSCKIRKAKFRNLLSIVNPHVQKRNTCIAVAL
jgi:hypothetical protein